MQKPKNLLPGLFLCVFSRIAEPLVDFIAVIYWLFPLFYLGQTFFAGKKGVSGPFYTGPFCTPHRLSTRFYFAQSAPTKGPLTKNPGTSSAPERALGNSHPQGPPRLYSAALFGTHRPPKGSAHAAPLQTCGSIWHTPPPQKAPLWRAPNRLKTTLLGLCTANLALFAHTKIPNAKAQRTPKRPKCPNAKTRGGSRAPPKGPMQKPRE